MMTETMLITIMSCHRLRTLACPMSSDIKPIIAKAVISGVWVCWGLYVLIGLGVDHQTTSGYDPHTLLCGFKGKDGGLSPFVQISFFLGFSTIISGMFLISVTNIIMVCLVITSYTGEVGKKTTPGTLDLQSNPSIPPISGLVKKRRYSENGVIPIFGT